MGLRVFLLSQNQRTLTPRVIFVMTLCPALSLSKGRWCHLRYHRCQKWDTNSTPSRRIKCLILRSFEPWGAPFSWRSDNLAYAPTSGYGDLLPLNESIRSTRNNRCHRHWSDDVVSLERAGFEILLKDLWRRLFRSYQSWPIQTIKAKFRLVNELKNAHNCRMKCRASSIVQEVRPQATGSWSSQDTIFQTCRKVFLKWSCHIVWVMAFRITFEYP